MIHYLRFEILSGTYLPSPYMYIVFFPPPPTPPTPASKLDWDDECHVIHEFAVVKCCFCYLNIFAFKIYEMTHFFFFFW